MTLGQRIQELRKQAGLSQEGLGEALGVSRQAVSKWESDAGIPELDTLIAISRFFGITIGELLGVEEPQKSEEKAEGTVGEEELETILRRYVEESRRHEQSRSPLSWPWIVALCCAAAAIIAVTVSVRQVREVKQSVNILWNNVVDIESIVSNVRNQVGGLSEEIRDTLEEESRLVSTCENEVVAFDVEKQEVTLSLTATLKDYTADSKLQFLVDWIREDETRGQTVSEWVTGPDFAAEIVLPMNFQAEISVRVEDKAGNIREQALVDVLYHLFPETFELAAYDLLQLVDLTITYRHSMQKYGYSEELSYVEIVSGYPDIVWPERAELAVYVDKETVQTVQLALSRAGDRFEGRAEGNPQEITLGEGDELKLVLTVTDNLGRVKEFTYRGTVNDGKLQQWPMEAPVVGLD